MSESRHYNTSATCRVIIKYVVLQYGGILVLIALYFLYVQDTGERGMTPKWWGILGLIGWAYLISVIYY